MQRYSLTSNLLTENAALHEEVEGMKVPNWRESSPELKAAWFEFKSKYTGAGTPCLSSFAAGWNMQKQQAHRQGWEQAKMEAVKVADKIGFAAHSRADAQSCCAEIADAIANMSYDAANSEAALEYKEANSD